MKPACSTSAKALPASARTTPPSPSLKSGHRQQAQDHQELGTFSEMDFTVVGLGTPARAPRRRSRRQLLRGDGSAPVLGRLLGPADDGPNATGAAVLTYRFWTSSLHSDPNVLGKTVRFEGAGNARNAVIVGVLEPSVPYPVETELIANIVTSPHHLSATMVTGREHRMTEIFAPPRSQHHSRGRPRRAPRHYAAMLSAHPEIYKPEDHYQIAVTRIHDQINSRANTILWVLFAASGLLFIIACSNVANLVLARTVRRESELAVRSALGASTAALRRSLLAESLVLCGSGAIAALLLAAPMVAVLGHYAARFSVRAEGLSLDFSLVWFGIALALIAAVCLAFVPRLPSADASRSFSLNTSGSRVTSGSSRRRLRIFAITQITASFLLLAGAAALMRTLFVLEQTQPPFDTAHVLAINLPVMSYGRTPEQVSQFYRDVARNVAALPGVEHVATGFSVPWRDGQGLDISFMFAVDGAKRENGQEDPRARFRSVSPGFFDPRHASSSGPRLPRHPIRTAPSASSSSARASPTRSFPGQPALNRELRWTDGVMKFIGISPEPRRIVGVVPDFDDENIIPSPPWPSTSPSDQEGWPAASSSAPTRIPTRSSPSSPDHPRHVRRSARRARQHPQDIRAEVLTPDRLNAIVFGGFASVALLISVVGVAGVLAFSVSGRTREFGIRMALGAQPRSILTDVLSEGLIIASIGVAVGMLAGFGIARITARFLTGMQMPGALTLIVSAAIILAAAVIASAVPAARAAKVNPVEALRSE
jgi:predicted permease